METAKSKIGFVKGCLLAVILLIGVFVLVGIFIIEPSSNEATEVVEIPSSKYNTSKLPKGISVYGFQEEYDKPYGKYKLSFYLKNETGGKIEFPQVDGKLFVDGKFEGTVTAGPGKHLENMESGLCSFAYILPLKVPDAVVFEWVK